MDNLVNCPYGRPQARSKKLASHKKLRSPMCFKIGQHPSTQAGTVEGAPYDMIGKLFSRTAGWMTLSWPFRR